MRSLTSHMEGSSESVASNLSFLGALNGFLVAGCDAAGGQALGGEGGPGVVVGGRAGGRVFDVVDGVLGAGLDA